MRKQKIFKMVCHAAEEVLNRGKLPKGVSNFFDLVRLYSKNVISDVTNDEIVDAAAFLSHLTQRAEDDGNTVRKK
jgi:hypothetical protein